MLVDSYKVYIPPEDGSLFVEIYVGVENISYTYQ
jgi:hypothetical protein